MLALIQRPGGMSAMKYEDIVRFNPCTVRSFTSSGGVGGGNSSPPTITGVRSTCRSRSVIPGVVSGSSIHPTAAAGFHVGHPFASRICRVPDISCS